MVWDVFLHGLGRGEKPWSWMAWGVFLHGLGAKRREEGARRRAWRKALYRDNPS